MNSERTAIDLMKAIYCLTAFLILSTIARADTVHLRNGESIEGHVSREGDEYTVELPDGSKLSLSSGEVDRVERSADIRPAAGADDPAVSATRDVEAAFAKLKDASESDANKIIAEIHASGEHAVPGLAALLKNSDAEKRALAARLLGAIGSASGCDALCEAMLDEEPAVRTAAAKALGAIGSSAARVALLTALTTDTSDDVRIAAIGAVNRIADRFSVPFLVDALRNPRLRPLAEEGIGKLDEPGIVPCLYRLLEKEDEAVKRSALKLLPEKVKPCDMRIILELLGSEDAAARRAAAQALAKLRVRKDVGVAANIELFEKGSDDMKKSAEAALKKATGKSFDDAAKWREWYASSVFRRIYLVPIAGASQEAVKKLAFALQAELKTPAVVRESMPMPAAARMEGDGCNAEVVLNELKALSRKLPDALRVIGVTNADLVLPKQGFFFSPYIAGGPVVLSTLRLRAGDSQVTQSRAITQALHALGYSLHLPPCKNMECPLSDVFVADDLDTKKPRLCEICSEGAAKAIVAERLLAAWDPKACEEFDRMAASNPTDGTLEAAAYVNEMWRNPDKAAIQQWRKILTGKDERTVNLINKRLKLIGM